MVTGARRAVGRAPVALELVAVDAGVNHRALRPQLIGESGRAVVGHRLEEAGDAAEELLPVKARIEDEPVGGERRREVGEAEVHVGGLAPAGPGRRAGFRGSRRSSGQRASCGTAPTSSARLSIVAAQQRVEASEPLADLLQQREVRRRACATSRSSRAGSAVSTRWRESATTFSAKSRCEPPQKGSRNRTRRRRFFPDIGGHSNRSRGSGRRGPRMGEW